MKIKRSRKSREMDADRLLKVSAGLTISFLVAVLVLPLSAIISGDANQLSSTPEVIKKFMLRMSSWQGIAFIVLEGAVFCISIRCRDKAFDIYDELEKEEKSQV